MPSGQHSRWTDPGQTIARVLSRIVLVLYLGVLSLVVILDRRVHYYLMEKNVPLLPNWALIAIAAAIIAALWMLQTRFGESPKASAPSRSHRFRPWIAATVTVGLFAYQVVSFEQAGFITGWDAANVTTASLLPSPLSQSIFQDPFYYLYFSHYPNNILLLVVLRAENALRSALSLPVTPEAFYAYISMLLVSLSFFVFTLLSDRLLDGRSFSFAADGVFLVLVGLSPWYMIPYSDTYALFCCTLLLYLATCAKPSLSAFLGFGALGAFSYSIKPTCIFVVLAAIVLWLLARPGKERLVDVFKRVSIVLASLVVALGLISVWTGSLGIAWDEDVRIGASHFAMMGLSDETDGIFSQDDVDASLSQPDVSHRQQMNYQVILQRLRDYGPWGLLKHLCKKALVCFNDGTFAWWLEGNFFAQPISGSFGEKTNFFRSYIYPEGYYEGPNFYAAFCTIEQDLWLICLTGIPFCLLARRTQQPIGRHAAMADSMDATWLVIVFTLGALFLFLMVFEARARYVYLYSGYYVLLGMHGFQLLDAHIGKTVGRRAANTRYATPRRRD